LTRSFKSYAVIAAKRLPTTSVEFSLRDTRARYLARRRLDTEALRQQSA